MTTNRTRTMRALSGLLIALALGACTTTSLDPNPSTPAPSSSAPTMSPSPTMTPTADPAVTEAESLILEAYRGYWAAKVASYADPTQQQDPNLAVYAVDKALAEAQSAIFQLQSDGIRLVGEPVLDPQVSNIVVGPEGSADIHDCVDSANWTPISITTGDPAGAPDQYAQVQAFATAYFFDNRWTIRTFTADRQAPC